MWGTKSARFALLCVLYFGSDTTVEAEGRTDFPQLVKSETFVDKTLLIKALFDGDYHIVTAPQGFGKSTNVDMLRRFLEIGFDATGEPIVNAEKREDGTFVEKQPTDNYALFRDNNLNIYQNKDFFHEHCGSHTVIYVSFKSVAQEDYEDTVKGFQLAVSKAFKDNKHIVQKLNEEDKTRFLKYSDSHGTLTVPEVQCGLTFLSRIINQHYRKKPIVLVDDFDTPVLDSIYEAYNDVDKTVQFIREIYSHLLIENNNVERALLTATDPKLADILTKYTNLNNYLPIYPNEFTLHPFLGGAFSRFYGFSADEVRKLLGRFKLEERFQLVKIWYGGYTLHGSEMFNPVSVLEFLKTDAFGPYYLQPDGVKHLKEIFFNPKIQDPVDKLLSGEKIVLNTLNVNLNVDYVLALSTIFKKPLGHKLKKDGIDYANVFVHYLADHGFFDIREDDENIKVRVPNLEVATVLSEKLHSVTFYVDRYKYEYMNVIDFVESLKKMDVNDPKTLQEFRKCTAKLYEKDFILPKNDYELYSPIYTFAKTFGKFKPIVGKSHAIVSRNLDVLMIRQDGTAIALQTKFNNGSAVDCLKEIFSKGYHRMVGKQYGDVVIKDTIYIGLHLSEDRKVSISYLVNSDDVSKAIVLEG